MFKTNKHLEMQESHKTLKFINIMVINKNCYIVMVNKNKIVETYTKNNIYNDKTILYYL